MDLKFVDRNRRQNVKELDKTVKNKFNWAWLEEKDVNGDFLSDYVRKLTEAGAAWCTSCNAKIMYGSSGKKALIVHSKNVCHVKSRRTLKGSQSLPSMLTATKKLEDCTLPAPQHSKSVPYGVSENIAKFFSANATSERPVPKQPEPVPVSLADRKSHLEGLLCTFIAEHDLPLSMAPKRLALCKETSKDPKALNEISMERVSASYKLVHGVNAVLRKRLLNKMRENTFSLNLDESTTKASNRRVMNILVCFFSDELGESVTELYCSLEMTTVNASTVYQAVKNQLEKDGIPPENLIALLTVSAAYTRGCHNGFQKKMKDDMPHLVDINGDVCHHMHNIVKAFSSDLDESGLLNKLLDDTFNDFKYSPDLKESLNELSQALGRPVLCPLERVPHRWLSLYDTTMRMRNIIDALTLFYFPWLSQGDKELYQHMKTDLMKDMDKTKRAKVVSVWKKLKEKNLTKAGLERKKRIVDKLFVKRKMLEIISALVTSLFPMFKSFVLLFEQKQPMVHKLHDSVMDTYRHFLACFMKLEFLYGKDVLKVELSKEDCQLPLKQIFTGSEAGKLLDSMKVTDKLDMLRTLRKAYINTAGYMKQKLPLTNRLFQCLSALDPDIQGHSVAEKAMKDLRLFFPSLTVNEDDYEADVYHLLSSKDTPSSTGLRLDHWWAQLFPKFPTLAPIVKACLAIFTGPRVEQSFSMMNHIITSKTNRMAISTYASYQAVKYHLLTRNKTSVELYRRDNAIYDPVDKPLVFHIQTAKNRSGSSGASVISSVKPAPTPSIYQALPLPPTNPASS